MDWLNGVPPPVPGSWLNYRTDWCLSVPSEVQSCYLSSFERGDWGGAPARFPVEELEVLCRVRSVEDQKSVWEAFSRRPRIQYSSDVLRVLMDLGPNYPLPVTPLSVCVQPASAPHGSGVLHPGPIDCMNVDIPERLRMYEYDTNWQECQCWTGPYRGFSCYESEAKAPEFVHLLDQLNISSSNEPVDGLKFEEVMKMEPPPWNHLAEVAATFRTAEQIQIVSDWGLVMRMASSCRSEEVLTPWRTRPLEDKRNRLEKALLQFLTKRLVYEKLIE